MNRAELLMQVYQILPDLIGQANRLPDVSTSNSDDQIDKTTTPVSNAGVQEHIRQWGQLYELMKDKLGDWNLYHQVFDPTQDTEAVAGALADDIADIYADLRDGLVFIELAQGDPDEAIWTWRLSFYSHWGKHAIDALLTIHFRLQNSVA
jgi:hypothetical protein